MAAVDVEGLGRRLFICRLFILYSAGGPGRALRCQKMIFLGGIEAQKKIIFFFAREKDAFLDPLYLFLGVASIPYT